MGYSYIAPVTGTFVSTGSPILVNLFGIGDIVKFEIWDETQFGATTADTDMLAAWWYKDMAAGSAFVQNRVSGQATDITTNMVLSGGFSLVDPTGPSLQAKQTGTAVDHNSPAEVHIAGHGYQTGDVIRITNTTGDLQISSIDYTITRNDANTFFLTNLDNTQTNLAAATNVVGQKLNYLPPYSPRRASILNLEASGVNTILTLAITTNFTVGQAVRVYVPQIFGSGTNPFASVAPIGTNSTIQQIVTATIVAIGAADASGFTNTITVNINSSAFTWEWPTNAQAAAGIQYPFVEPVGEAATTMAGSVNPANLLDDRTVNTASFAMSLGTSVCGVASDVIRWIAWRALIIS